MGSRIVLTQSAPCNNLMPEVFPYKDKKSNWPLPFYMLKRKRMFYGPKEAIWNEYEKAYKGRYMTKTKWNFLSRLRKRLQQKKESFQWMSYEMILKHVWMWILSPRTKRKFSMDALGTILKHGWTWILILCGIILIHNRYVWFKVHEMRKKVIAR